MLVNGHFLLLPNTVRVVIGVPRYRQAELPTQWPLAGSGLSVKIGVARSEFDPESQRSVMTLKLQLGRSGCVSVEVGLCGGKVAVANIK